MKHERVWEWLELELLQEGAAAQKARTRGLVEESAVAYGAPWLESAWWELRDAAASGLPWRMVEVIKEHMGWSDATCARFLRISEKTLQRCRASGGRLNTDSAEKVLDLSRLLLLGREVFGSGERFQGWLATPGLWFDGHTPEALLFDDFGRQLVREALGRIEHGLWA